MNLKKNWKRFWTLSSAREGFTLVELIVVIAILAILAGVAVPAYSGYVKKANMQADMTLASEVAHALTLYYYAHPEEVVSGFVVLNREGVAGGSYASNDAMTAAMDAVFGAGWANTAVLKYDGWTGTGDGTASGNVTRVALEHAQAGIAGTVGTSSFITGSTPEELMTNVTDLTFVATGLFENMNDDIKYSVIQGNLFNGDPALLESYCKNFGITTEKDAAGNTIFSEGVTNEQLSNLLVFGAAQQLTNGTDTTVTGLVLDYAGFAGFVNSVKGTASEQAAQAAYTKLNTELSQDNNNDGKINSDDIAIAFNNFQNNEAFKSELDAYRDDENETYLNDMTAFLCIMDAVDEASGIITPEEMKDADLFTSNKVAGHFDTYIAATDAASKMSEADIEKALAAMNAGAIVVTLSNGTVADSAGILLN